MGTYMLELRRDGLESPKRFAVTVTPIPSLLRLLSGCLYWI